jgi:hypothetical protein
MMMGTVGAGDPPLYKEGEVPDMKYEKEQGQKLFIIQLRENRNKKLEESGKYMLPDYPISAEDLEKMKSYRQELRDYFQRDELINFEYPNLPLRPI